jgi:hypothetical protein
MLRAAPSNMDRRAWLSARGLHRVRRCSAFDSLNPSPPTSILPDPFQYLGLYTCLSFILHAYFGPRLLTRLFGTNVVFVIAGGLFLLLSPAVTWRIFGHYALASHWLVLASLDFYLRATDRLKPWQWLTHQWVLLALAGAINPYIAALCLFSASQPLCGSVLSAGVLGQRVLWRYV